MNKTSSIRFGSSVVGAVAVALLVAACAGSSDDASSAIATSRDDISSALAKLPNANIVSVDADGVPTFITGNLGSVAAHQMAQSDVSSVLAVVAPAFRSSTTKLVFKSTQKDNIGDLHYRFSQTRNGLPVIGAELLVHVRNGAVYAANGSVRDDLIEPGTATINAAAAATKAKAASIGVAGITAVAQTNMAYYQHGTTLHLVHQVDVKGTDSVGTPVHDIVLVDATDGSIAARLPQIETALVRAMYDAQHKETTPGTLMRSEGGATVSDNIVNDNYDRLGTVWSCYHDMFNRDSYDNAGAKYVSSVHYSTNYVNAYWDGTQMVYGDGDGVQASNLAESMDVTAHELTHAVTASTSNLTYDGQSGGLNEGMSDIFGATCDYYYMGRTTVDPVIWMIGHDIWTPAIPNDGLRYMNDPAKDGNSIDWAPDYNDQDVHYTSGVPNLAYSLLVTGGQHPRGKSTIQVPALGIEKAAQVFYRANTTIFTASTDYAAAKTACEQAATQLGYSADDIAAVTAAWEAVGVGITPSGGGGTTSSSSSSSSSSSGSGGTCAHDECTAGTNLPSSCDPCVTKICKSDSYCCSTKWDAECVKEVASVCSETCSSH